MSGGSIVKTQNTLTTHSPRPARILRNLLPELCCQFCDAAPPHRNLECNNATLELLNNSGVTELKWGPDIIVNNNVLPLINAVIKVIKGLTVPVFIMQLCSSS